MDTVDWNLFFLRDNPFTVVPPEDAEDVKWFGMPKLKHEIEQKLIEAKQSSATQFILNRGPYGGGKTHALRYYSLLSNWPRSKKSVREVHDVISVNMPKETGKIADDFYTDILEQIGMSKIRGTVTTALKEIEEEEALLRLKNITGSENLARAIFMLGKSHNSVKNKLFDSDVRAEQDILVDAYFLGGCTKPELRKLGLARNIDKAQDRFRILAGLFHCFIGLSPSRDAGKHNRLCLWIDEMEALVFFTTAQSRPFTQGVRDLIDRLPAFFTLILNFSLAEPLEFQTIEILMGKALLDRVTSDVIFKEMNMDEAIQYVTEMLEFWRTDDFKSQKFSPIYPFEEEALRYLIENAEKRTPRTINLRCGNVATYVLQNRRRTQTPGKIKVDLSVVKEYSRSELDQEVE